MSKWLKQIPMGEMVPDWYGIYYKDYMTGMTVCLLMPFHIPAMIIRNAYLKFKYPQVLFKELNSTLMAIHRYGIKKLEIENDLEDIFVCHRHTASHEELAQLVIRYMESRHIL